LTDASAIILAGGSSTRFGQDKGLLRLANKPLALHVLDAVSSFVDEKIVVTSSKVQAENYARIVGSDTKVIIDWGEVQTPLFGALTGFEESRGIYSLLLPCDTPLVSHEILSLLLELCPNKSAAIPRWPNGYIEPLQAVYYTRSALDAAKRAMDDGGLNMRDMVSKLNGVRYVSTLVLQQLDPNLDSFFNVNTALDMKKAESLLKHKR
jgi:molybdopterin-guanine dinucleotide biosynthesis protein A